MNDLFNFGGKKTAREIVTPYKLTMALMIRTFCQFRNNQFGSAPPVTPQHRRDFCIMMLELLQGPDRSLPELRHLLRSNKYNIDPWYAKQFDNAVRRLDVLGIDYIFLVVNELTQNTTESHMKGLWYRVNKNSVFGCYIRRLLLFFEKLSFSEVTQIMDGFKEFFEPCSEIITRQYYNPYNTRLEEQDPANTSAQNINVWNQWSRRQAELFIATQAALLTNNVESALPPADMQKRIQELLKSNPDLAEAHFLSYLNYLRVHEFCGALESLHHSFDRSTPVYDGKNVNMSIDEKSKVFRYAALNLAALQAKFNNKEEAMMALREAIRMAQETNDNICLQHALTWMYKLTTDPNKVLLMEHSITKSTELELPYIVSLGLQSLSQHVARYKGCSPKLIFERMTKSDEMNCLHLFMDLLSDSYMQRSAIWSLYGKKEMALQWAQLTFFLNTDDISEDKSYVGESACQALCVVAHNLVQEGNYILARSVLNLAKKRFPHEPISNNWNLHLALLNFTQALHEGDWTTAESAALDLAHIDRHECRLCLSQLRLTRADFEGSLMHSNSIIDDPDPTLTPSIKIRATILQAEARIAASTASTVPSVCLLSLSSALASARAHKLDYLCAVIKMALAYLQLLLGIPRKALELLDTCMVEIMANGCRYDRARARFLYAKCTVADKGLKSERAMEIVEMLDKVKDDFEKIEAHCRVKDVLYFQALVYNEIGDIESRNRCSLEYRMYINEYPTSNNSRSLVML